MAIYRTAKVKDYTRFDNAQLWNKDLSLTARFTLMVLLSLWDDFRFSIKNIASKAGVGQDTVRSALNELEAKGYLVRRRIRVDGQYQGVEYDIYESPSLNPAFATAPASKKPAKAKPKSVKPAQAEPQDISNNNIINIYDNKNQSINQDGQIEAQIRSQIEYDILRERYDSRLLDDLVGVMVEVMMIQTDTIEVRRGTAYPAAYVRSCLARINPLHIEQIMETLKDTQPTIRNTRGYLLTTLINAANTMSMSYQYGDY